MSKSERKDKTSSRVQLNGDFDHHIIRKFFLAVLILGCLGAAGGYTYVKQTTPTINKYKLLSHQGHYSTIYASNGQIIWGASHIHETNAAKRDVKGNIRPALLSIEDRDFYHEHGFNLFRTLHAVFLDLLHRNKQQGGSTLTEQLVKNSVFPANTNGEKSIKEKIREIELSSKVNRQYSKNEILWMYINKVYMGSGIYGMGTASYYYFNRPLGKTSISQAALLAGIVQSPSSYDPYIHPTYALKRRNTVLYTMYKNHKISAKTAKHLCHRPLKDDIVPLNTKKKQAQQRYHTQLLTDDYTQSVLRQMKAQHVNLSAKSYQVKTPLNMKIQQRLYDVVNHDKNIPWPSEHLNVAATVINNRTGQAVAQLGGRGRRPLGAYNQAIMPNRSTGSSIKPILDYAPAMDDLGWSTAHTIKDGPYEYPGTHNHVYDWDDRYQGNLTLARALMNSRNIPAIKTLAAVGLKRANKLMERAGMPNQDYYANAIGANASTAQLASAYSTLADYGVRKQLSYVSQYGASSKLKTDVNSAMPVMSAQTAFMLTNVLEHVPTKHELGQDAILNGINQAGKTGTVGYANGNKGMSKNAISDAWYVGYTKGYTIAIWTGYNNPKHAMTQKQANVSEMIYHDLMKYVAKQGNTSDWAPASGLRSFHKDDMKQYADKSAHDVTSPSLRPFHMPSDSITGSKKRHKSAEIL